MTLNNAITDVRGIEVGHAQDDEALTGCTVILCRKGAVGGVDVRGGAPGTRETDLLNPVNLVEKVHAIVLAKGRRLLGIGAGQMSRVDSTRFAIQKARHPLHGAVLGSDAFIPFRDTVDLAAAAGIAAVIQPGGSIRDEEVVAAANERAMAMVFTSVQHFRH